MDIQSQSRSMMRYAAVVGAGGALVLCSVLISACSDDDGAISPTATAVATAPASPAGAPTPDAPAAPTGVQIAGPIPDLRTPVPEGQGELGRITVSWTDRSADEDGFRIYQDCDGTISQLAETSANETSLGPLQACRPGRVGVASFNAAGVSEIKVAFVV